MNKNNQIAQTFVLLFCVLVLVFLYFLWYGTQSQTQTQIQQDDYERKIRKLVRQAARWSTAAKQDESPMISVLHAYYGAGYLWALKDIASVDEIENIAHINMFRFEEEITQIMDESTKKMIGACPEFGPEPSYLSMLGGESLESE